MRQWWMIRGGLSMKKGWDGGAAAAQVNGAFGDEST